MTAIDTNVLVRYLAQDDETQFLAVLKMFSKKKATFYLPDIALIETDWVLRSLYQWTASEVAEAFASLTSVHNLVFEDEARLRASLKALRAGADLADELIARSCRAHGCTRLATFDKGMIRRHKPFAAEPT